jgi:hypothetical protein
LGGGNPNKRCIAPALLSVCANIHKPDHYAYRESGFSGDMQSCMSAVASRVSIPARGV